MKLHAFGEPESQSDNPGLELHAGAAAGFRNADRPAKIFSDRRGWKVDVDVAAAQEHVDERVAVGSWNGPIVWMIAVVGRRVFFETRDHLRGLRCLDEAVHRDVAVT